MSPNQLPAVALSKREQGGLTVLKLSSASVVALTLIIPGEAGAVDGRVSAACANDYLAYCSKHNPDGPGVRRCMRAAGPRLSPTCVNALIDAGEVSKAEVARRARTSSR
jgi:hypothetical protein